MTTNDKKFVEELTDQTDSFSRWYTEVILKAELADYAPVKDAWSCALTDTRSGRT